MESYYSKIAELYEQSHESFSSTVPLEFNSILDKILPGTVLLDAGCGPGIEAKVFIEKGIKVIGVDSSEGMIERFKMNNPTAEAHVGNLMALPLEDKTIDCVFASFCWLHLDLESGHKALREFKRVSRAGAKLFLSSIIGDGTSVYRTHTIAKTLSLSPIFFRWWTRNEIHSMLLQHGYRIDSYKEIKYFDHVPPFGLVEASLAE